MQIKQLVALSLITLIFAGWAAGLSYVTALTVPVVVGAPVTVEIAKGDSFDRITGKLIAQKLAIKPFWFKCIAFRQNTYQRLKAGEYELPVGVTVPQILMLLALGKTKQHAITFPEGWAFKQFIEELNKNQSIGHSAELASAALGSIADASALKKRLSAQGIDIEHPEGQFFPDTYYFAKYTQDVAVLKMAYDKMQRIIAHEWQYKADGLPLKSPYEALILASVIEKETGQKSERPQIAGVFTRRLQAGMMLQTDPTVIYGMGELYHGNISRQDLLTATPYNTYQMIGLPPTPIAMPGQDAIHAALHPDEGDSLYFVARGDGSHVFSATLAAHNQAVNLYQRNRP